MSNKVKVYGKDSNQNCSMSKQHFANAMKCDEALLDRLEQFTSAISKNPELNFDREENKLSGSCLHRFIGRGFDRNNETGKNIRIDLVFDEFECYRLTVSFWSDSPDSDAKTGTDFRRKLLKIGRPFYTTAEQWHNEYSGEYLGRWFRVPLNNCLESDEEADKAKTAVVELIKKVLNASIN